MGEEVFNNEVYPGPTQRKFSIRVDDPKGIAFEATQGMTRKEFEDQNRKAVNALFEPEEIGSVFETREKKLEEKALTSDKEDIKSVTNNGIDPNDIDALKKGLSNQEPNIKGPSVEPSLNFVK
jgi:hypothetical protein